MKVAWNVVEGGLVVRWEVLFDVLCDWQWDEIWSKTKQKTKHN